MRTIYDPMTYQPHMQQLDSQMFEEVQAAMQAFEQTTYTAKEVQAALRSTACTVQEFAALLSPAAQPFLEQMAEKAKREREKHLHRFISPIIVRMSAFIADLTVRTRFTAVI